MKNIHALTVIVVVTVLLVLGTMFVLIAYVNREATLRHKATSEACQRGNVIRAELNVLVATHPELGLSPIPLVNC